MAGIRKKVALVSGNHICSNPRIVKAADALTDAGFEVIVLSGSYAAALKSRDKLVVGSRAWRWILAYDLTAPGPRTFNLRLQWKLGRALHQYLRLPNRWQIFYGTGRLTKLSQELDPDLLIAHWEPALPSAYSRLNRGHRVGVDMEDWFSEDLLPAARAGRPLNLLKKMERELLTRGVYTSCTSEAMADALVSYYGCPYPTVIRNMFPAKDRYLIDGEWKDRPGLLNFCPRNVPTVNRPAEATVSIHWYSQTIGPGRGLEELIEAARTLTGNFEVNLRGDARAYNRWLHGVIPSELLARVHLHVPVPGDVLLSRVSEHDIGFCGEPADPPNKNLTISNKFFQYLQGGLAVVASATAGQKEGAREAAGAIDLYQPGDVDGLRDALQRLISNRTELNAKRAAAWKAGGRLCWENEAPRLVEAVEKALGRRSTD